MKIRARFTIDEKIEKRDGWEIKASPVVGNSEENERFFRFTPYGALSLGLVNPETAAQLAVGQTYNVDFTPAD
ncbi:hypothetical protein [Minwuia thermotolerans]|uniref:Uncharacterized protein n=1 Tax=Minwuia thermotolerans TaxID=2056226 RepID=A0A2M9G2R9_9PROT|nr:hypothetical protein [Minwuia thermotolerans]PJK29976.1 hypothetical protein CVT23_09420 [Minwuia thermotolerans]